ncbi:hypothetical protein [Sulfitobacter pontiacus]|uniref:hypothetical protein n=1 Tax=Sulfitobacter pontiacus TaxID=60137 RepID=UPI00044D631B|nr:hypothetical protein [Sulfitobacter pontiacus]KAJ30514.1 hypothetical protein PM01_10995 [Sulfitobacter pontiacus 3SOLIMAR09]
MLEFFKKNPVSLASLVVAVCALLFTAMQMDQSQIHNRVTLAPLVGIGIDDHDPTRTSGLYFENGGLGPAIVKGINLRIDGEEFRFETHIAWENVREHLNNNNETFGNEMIEFSSLPKNHFIGAGERHFLISVSSENASDDALAVLRDLVGRVEVGICYQSVYRDLFYVEGGGSEEFSEHCLDNYTSTIFGERIQFKAPWRQTLTYQDIVGD